MSQPLLLPTSFLPRWFPWLWAGVAFVGLLDAVYLTANHIIQGMTPCSLLEGCEIVTSSVYSTLGGVPIALFGAIFYGVVLVLVLYSLESGKVGALTLAAYLAVPAFVISLGLLAIQAFILQAFCLYCLISLLSSTALFIFGASYLMFR